MNHFVKRLALVGSILLAACGGGGGSGADSGSSGGGTVAPASFDQLTPDAAMDWQTGGTGSFAVTVSNAAGGPAANAAVRVFIMTMVNPDDGTALEEPVGLDLLDTTITDGSGQAQFDVRLANRLTEVLLVVTWNDQKASRRVPLTGAVNTVALTTSL